MGRVTVNGKLPEVGQKVSKTDIIMLDDIQVNFKQAQEHARTGAGKTQNLIFGEATAKVEKKEKIVEAKYVKYNKYAAARKAAKSGEKPKEKLTTEEKALKEAMRPKFGKSLGRAAVAQRLAASPKSASLRKTSKNNPINKAKRAAARNKPKGE